MGRIVLIVNPYATKVTEPRVRAVEEALAVAGDVETMLTEWPGHARELAATAGDDAEAICVFSGDGVYNEALNGACAGAGLSLACVADIRIASDRAVFVPAFVNLGLVPDAGASWFLPRLIGPSRAYHWLCTSRKLGAEEALAWGLVDEVVPADELAARAAETAVRYAALPTRA